MRIAVVSEGFFPEISGVTVAVAQHLRYLAARGHDVLLVHPRYPDDVLARMQATGAVAVPEAPRLQFASDAIAPYRPETRVPSREGAREIDAGIQRFGPAAVVYHNADRLVPELSRVWKPRRVAGLAAARNVGAVPIPIIHTLLPLLVECSGSWLWRTPPAKVVTRRIWSGIYNDNFEFAATVDAAARDYLRSVGIRVPLLAGPFNGVDTGTFRLRAAPAARTGPVRVCWIGRLVPEKNAQLLGALARACRAVGLDVQWVVVGDGPLAASLRREMASDGAVAFRGWLAPRDVAAELAASDLYLSLSHTESFSLTASEALATGVPVVAPDLIGFKRLAGKNAGMLFSPAWLTPDGMRDVALALQRALPHVATWSANAALEAPRLAWDTALDALYAALAARTGLPLA